MSRTITRRLTTGAVAVALGAAAMAGVIPDLGHHDAGTEIGAEANDAYATREPGGPSVTPTGKGRPPLSARAHRRATPVPVAEQHTAKPPAVRDEDDEIEENSNAYSTKQLTPGGGYVQTAPRIYLVFWGPNWFSGGDPYGAAARLHSFYQGLGGSSMNNVMKQYSSSNGSFINPTGQYKGWIQDTTPIPSRPTATEVAQAAQRAAARFGDYGYNTQFVIAMPYGVADQYTVNAHACAWHNWTPYGSSWITYTSLPYTPYLDDLAFGCGGGKVNGSNGRLDGVTIIAGHEYAESVTDPGVNAWKDADGSENADKCSWLNLRNYRLTNGYAFPVQPSWSNYFHNVYGYGCYYS